MRRTPFLALAAIAASIPAALAGPRAYDVSTLIRAPHPFANVPCCGLWPDAGPVRPTLPPEAGLRGHDIAPLLAQPHPFAGQVTRQPGVVRLPVEGAARTYDMSRFLSEPHPFDTGAATEPASSPAFPMEARPAAPPPPPPTSPVGPPRAAQAAVEVPRENRTVAAGRDDERDGRIRPYFGAAAGMTLLRDADNTGALLSIESTFDPGFHMAGTVGAQFASGLRLEFELAYRQVALDSLRVTRVGNIGGLAIGSVRADGDVSVLAFMFNAAWEFDFGGAIRPFVLAGLGPARVAATDVKAAGVSVADSSAMVFAWQVGAGGSYRLSENWRLDAAYRLFSTTDPTLTDSAGDSFDSEVMNHDFLIGARYLF